MTKSPLPTFQQLDARLHQQALEMASIRATLDIQLTRIGQMQTELDVLPHPRKRSDLYRELVTQPRSHTGKERSECYPSDDARPKTRP